MLLSCATHLLESQRYLQTFVVRPRRLVHGLFLPPHRALAACPNLYMYIECVCGGGSVCVCITACLSEPGVVLCVHACVRVLCVRVCAHVHAYAWVLMGVCVRALPISPHPPRS